MRLGRQTAGHGGRQGLEPERAAHRPADRHLLPSASLVRLVAAEAGLVHEAELTWTPASGPLELRTTNWTWTGSRAPAWACWLSPASTAML
ncbi:MAG: hypothetical protein R2909_20730 [Gemmatimonadales bacterium]